MSLNPDKGEFCRDATTREAETETVKVWDVPIRFVHWLLVIFMIAAYVTSQLDMSYHLYHTWTGYAVVVLVIFRILWGLIGTYHARFINFVRSPLSTTEYVANLVKGKGPRYYLGHNPLGAWMVIILLLGLLVQSVSGLFSTDEIFNVGPLYHYLSEELSIKLTSVHRQLFYWLAGAVALHILAVVFHLWVKRDNIVGAMVTGKKANRYNVNEPSIGSSRLGLAVAVFVAVIFAVALVVLTAPQPALFEYE